MSLHLYHVHRAFAALLVVVALGVAALTWMRVVQTLSSTKPVPAVMQARSIVWSDRVFESPSDLGRWLRARGASYAGWRDQHSAASAVLEHRHVITAQPTPTVPSSAAKTTSTGTLAKDAQRTTATQPVADASVSSGTSQSQRIFIGLLALLAAVFALAASLPRVVCDRFPNLARRIAPYRALLLASAGALMIGILAGAVLN